MTKPFTHIHSSSRFDRSDESLSTAAKYYSKRAALVTWTELDADRRKAVVRRTMGDDYGQVVGTMGYSNDCVISFRKSRFRLIYKENFKTTSVPYYDKRGNKKNPQYATIAVLQDRFSSQKVVVAVVHLAAGIEGLIREDQNTRSTLNWFASFQGVKRRCNHLRKHHEAAGIMLIADYNVDFKQRWAKALVKRLAGGYTNTWKNTNVAGGTLANRIIDWTLIKGRIRVPKGAKLFRDDNSSDHRPYSEVVLIDRPVRTAKKKPRRS